MQDEMTSAADGRIEVDALGERAPQAVLSQGSGLPGHKSADYATTEVHAKYDPDYLGKAAAAIDAYFSELRKHVNHQLVLPLRATCVPVAERAVTQVPVEW